MLKKLFSKIIGHNKTLIRFLNSLYSNSETQFDSPIFIIGSGRCGSSLFTKILESHPDLYLVQGEANELWHPDLYPFNSRKLKYDDPMEIDPKAFTELSIKHWPKNHRGLIKDYLSYYSNLLAGHRHLMVKSAMISFLLFELNEIYPKAKYIHLYRSGLPVIDSYAKKNYHNYHNLKYDKTHYTQHCAKYWNDCIFEIEKFKQFVHEGNTNVKLIEISYEDLCGNTIATITKISEFLNVKQEKFRYDFTKIESTNWKIDRIVNDPKMKEALELMRPGLELKGYFTHIQKT